MRAQIEEILSKIFEGINSSDRNLLYAKGTVMRLYEDKDSPAKKQVVFDLYQAANEGAQVAEFVLNNWGGSEDSFVIAAKTYLANHQAQLQPA